MSWRRVVSVSAAIVLIGSLAKSQAPGSALSAGDLVQMAIERNREFLAFKQRVAETQALLRQAGVRPSPALEIQESTGSPLGTTGEQEFSVGYFHVFETSGKRAKRISVAQKSARAAEAEVADRIRRLTFEVKVRYAEAAAEQRKFEMIGRLLGINRESYRITEARVRQGDAAPLEQQLLLTDLSRAEAQLVVFTSRAERALLELQKFVGLAPSQSLELANDLAPAASDIALTRLREQALQSRPDLHVLRLLEEQALAEVELARAEARPDLTASARFSRRESSFDQLGFNRTGELTPLRDRDNLLTFGLSVPLFRQKRNQGAIEAAQARSVAARLRREHLEAVIRLEVEAAFRRWSAGKHALEILSQGVVAQSEKNLAVIREAYSLGQLRILDVLNEQRRLVETHLTYIDAQSDLFQSHAELERAVGGTIR